MVKQIKFQKQLSYAQCLGSLLANKLNDYYQQTKRPDVIIPVPLHYRRLRQRGYNQAMEIARPIAKQLSIPLKPQLSQRIRHTAAQSSLTDQQQRLANVKKAFVANDSVQGKHVLLIDDVITTGSTINAICRSLRQQAVKQIDIAVCAKTVL